MVTDKAGNITTEYIPNFVVDVDAPIISFTAEEIYTKLTGEKSVHLIGLFPDKFNDITLDQKALYDLILSKVKFS